MIYTLLLAAGFSRRFGSDKLMHPLENGKLVIQQAIEHLQLANKIIMVVVRPEQKQLIRWLTERDIPICPCPEATQGMGNSIACGVRATSNAAGWLIALADMPYIWPDTISKVINTVQQNHSIARPAFQGQAGHPVGFAKKYYDELITLQGDKGAKGIINKHHVDIIQVNDPGITIDIDQKPDLA